MAYNPSKLYESANNILNLKGRWEAADEEERKKIEEQAQQHYKNLMDGGWSNIANQLQNSNYSQAQGVVNSVGQYTGTNGFVYDQGVRDLQNRTNDLWGIQADDHDNYFRADPFESTMGKNLMDSYINQGNMAGYNEIAAGAGTNGGNVDSYSQANAMRQLKSFKDAGTAAVLNAWESQKSGLLNSHAGMQNTLGIMRGNNQSVFDNNETALNNKTARLATQADYTGQVPYDWAIANNEYFNGDDVLINPNADYQSIINEQEEILRTSTDPTKKAIAQDTINKATQARLYKILNIPGYEQYRDTMQTTPAQQTEQGRQFDASDATTRYGIDKQYDAQIYGYDTEKYGMDIGKELGMAGYASTEKNTQNTNATNERIAQTGGSGGGSSNSGVSKQELMSGVDNSISGWLYSPYADLEKIDYYGDFNYNTSPQYAAATKMQDPDVLSIIKDQLLKAGYTNTQVDSKIAEYKTNIAKQIASIEGKDYNDNNVIKSIKSRYGW